MLTSTPCVANNILIVPDAGDNIVVHDEESNVLQGKERESFNNSILDYNPF